MVKKLTSAQLLKRYPTKPKLKKPSKNPSITTPGYMDRYKKPPARKPGDKKKNSSDI